MNAPSIEVQTDPELQYSYDLVRHKMMQQACAAGGGHFGGFVLFGAMVLYGTPIAIIVCLIALFFVDWRQAFEIAFASGLLGLPVHLIRTFRKDLAFEKDRAKHCANFEKYCELYLPEGRKTFVVNLDSL